MTRELLILEYLRVFLTAPVMTAVIALTFVFIFKDEIKAFINRLWKITVPGGGLEASQSKSFADELAGENKPVPIPEQNEPPLPAGLNPDQQSQIKEIVRAERAASYLWEYRFLNRFLVYKTQQVLDWLIGCKQRVTFRLYDSHWVAFIPDAQERNAIIDALQAHHLIQIADEVIEVTDKGKEYQQWRGPIDNAPAT